jgi:hypothetical protein
MEKNQNFSFDFVGDVENATIIWDHLNIKSQPIHLAFYDTLKNHKDGLSHIFQFNSDPAIYTEKGQKDVVATIFYMINCLQEYNQTEDNSDAFGRFKFESSYQFRFGVTEENLVQHEIDSFFKKFRINGTNEKSSFFISHDVDNLYGSFVQDGFWALKKMRIDIILRLIANELIRNPHWKNMDKIIKLNNEYDIRSTFFWLVNQGTGKKNIRNADYTIKKEKDLVHIVNKSGFFNGLHKSCSDMSINEELQKGELNTRYNRYHFLNFSTYSDWEKISASEIKLDCSLGFAERYGFRNSYGQSFQPFNFEKNQPFDFIETPLTFMDTTFYKYMKQPANNIGNSIIDFYERNSYNCHHSLLWHNTSFTNYKYGSLLKEYKKIIGYLYETKIAAITPDEIIDKYTLGWDF